MQDKDTLSTAVKTEALTKLIELCHTHLFTPDGEQVLRYFKCDRKLTEDSIKAFKLGVFPRYADVAANTMGAYNAWKLGITGFDTEGSIVSKFINHNVIIPVFDQDNLPVAIIARSTMSEKRRRELGAPKYINSFYKKSGNLFGLNLNKDVIRKQDQIILAEGNLDVITSWQNNLRNVVGISNANLSKNQLILASRYAKNIILLMDQDEAGQNGIKKALETHGKTKGINISAGVLPADAKDLDEFFSKGYTALDITMKE